MTFRLLSYPKGPSEMLDDCACLLHRPNHSAFRHMMSARLGRDLLQSSRSDMP